MTFWPNDWCKSKKICKIFLWKQMLASNLLFLIMVIHIKIPFWNKLEMSRLDIIFFLSHYDNSWRADPCCISFVFRTINWAMDPNRRPGKTRPLVKSRIFHNWEKGLKRWHTHRYSHTYTRIYVSTYHILLDKVWFRVMGYTEGVLKSMSCSIEASDQEIFEKKKFFFAFVYRRYLELCSEA